MECLQCQAQNPRDAVFCENCGTRLEVACSNCGGANRLGANFCNQCGQRLLEAPPPMVVAAGKLGSVEAYTPRHLPEKILTSKSTLEGERKQVTVFFADLKDSTRLIVGLDPEDAQQLLDPAIHLMMDVVHRFEGTVNQVLGDGIMALFGAPVAYEDHTLRACYAALELQNAIRIYAEEVRRKHGMLLQLRVGLNAGTVIVRAMGNDLHTDYSAVGQHTVLAARMEQLAAPGTILLTAAVLRLVEGLVRVKPVGPLQVKGFTEPVEGFELLGPSDIRRRLQAAALRGLTRFIGREREMAALTRSLDEVRAGHGQLVAIVGEPGVGKSRLVYECLQSPRIHGWRVLETASASYGKVTPYFPVLELLKRYAQVDDSDDPHTIRDKVTGHVLALDETLQDTLPALLSLLEALPEDSLFFHLEPSERRQRTLAALQQLLLRESQVQPLLLVFEDLHWIDSETQALIDRLAEQLPTAQLLLLVNYRPEYQHGWGSKTYYTEVPLDPLPTTNAAEVLHVLLGNDPSLASLKALLIKRTEGNPLFLEESLRALEESGALVGTSGAYVQVKPLDSVEVPATIQAVLATRIDRLPAEQKRLLQTAAVIGTEVPARLLRAIVNLPEASLHRGLTYLKAAEFLYETRLFPEPEYTFKHALTHEVAYNTLLLKRRCRLHARIIGAIETLMPEWASAQVERLAHHAVRGEVWHKAVTYCQQAGVRSYDRAAFHEAVAFFEQALQALAHLPEDSDTQELAIHLRLALDGPLRALGEHRRRVTLLGEAEGRALKDQARLGRVLASMALALRATGDLDGAIATGQQALDVAVALGDNLSEGEASLHLGQIYYATGDFGKAAELVRRNVTSDRELDTSITDLRIESQMWLAQISSVIGTFAEGRRHGEEALRLATLTGRGATPIVAHNFLGALYLAQGDLEHAIPLLEQGLALSRASGSRNLLRQTMASLGYAVALRGRLAEGRALLEEGITEGMHTGGPIGNACRIVWLSEVCRLAGHHQEAWQHAGRALDLAQQYKQRGNEALALYQLGIVQADANSANTREAEANYHEALDLAKELGMRPLQAHCHLGLGTLYATASQWQQARAVLTTAIEFYRAMDMTFWLPGAEAVLAQVQ